jgi:hypothetical protein
MRKSLSFFMLLIVGSLLATAALAGDGDTKAMTVAVLAADVAELEGQECQVIGTIIGACKSGCKMWIADASFKEGDAIALVRAKDDAFQFDTSKQGAQVVLTGYVVGQYKDFCADDAAAGHAEPAAGEQAGSCQAPVKIETSEKGELEGMTFFATKVEYIKKTDA